MKTFRLIGMAMMAVLMSFTMASCGDDDDDDSYNGSGSTQSTSQLVGTWKCTSEEYAELGITQYIQFTSGGKVYEVDIDEDGVSILYGNWTQSNDKLTMSGGNSIASEATIIELSETSLILNLLLTVTYEKVDDSEIAPYLSGEYEETDDDDETVEASGDIEYTYENGEATVAYQNESLSGTIVIPSTVTYNGASYKVTGVANYAFARSNVTSVTFPSTITELPHGCFYQCYKLTSVTLPSNATELAYGCFMDCTSLKSITLPSTVTSLGAYCFDGCTSLTSINLSNTGITKLREGCFEDCTSLTSITLCDGITSMGNGCFSGCTSLKSITLPSSITSLESQCFEGCTSLTSMTCKWTTSSALSGVTVDSMAFGYLFDVTSNCTLYVPSGTKSIYEAKSPWKNFKSIVEQ